MCITSQRANMRRRSPREALERVSREGQSAYIPESAFNIHSYHQINVYIRKKTANAFALAYIVSNIDANTTYLIHDI